MWRELKCINIRRTRNVDLGWVNMSVYNFISTKPRFTKFILFNAEKIVLIDAVYSLPLSLSLPEIFALKIKRFPKLGRLLHVFCPPKF